MEHNALLNIAKLLNEQNIQWALGASYALYFYGLVDQPRDIDIFVDDKDIDRTIKMLSGIANLENEPPKGNYLTEYFYYFTYLDTEIDIISNFRFKHSAGIYTHTFDEQVIVKSKTIEGVKIPIMAVEDWYILYLVMSNKKGRGDLTESYLIEQGIKHRDLMERALNQPLSDDVRNRINNLLKI